MESTITSNIKKIDHIVLTTGNIEDCLQFYKSLGFEVIDRGYRYEVYAGDFKINIHIEGHELQPNAYHACPGTLDLCMEIDDDIYKFRENLLMKGFEVSEIGYKSGVNGEMKSFYLRDPDRNLLEFCSY